MVGRRVARRRVRLAGRPWNDVAQELQEVLEQLLDSGDEGLAPPHAETHMAGGSDPIALDELDSPADSTDLDATTSAHGLLPKLDGSASDFLRGDGTWAVPPSGGALQLIEDQTLSAPATTLTFSGLDGDDDEVYLLKYKIVKGVVATVLTTLRPNGATTNQASRRTYGGTASGNVNTTDIAIGGNGSAATDDVEVGECWIDAKTGTKRSFHGQWSQINGAGPTDLLWIISSSAWTDTAANITSLDVVSDQANGLGAGSYFRLYRLTT